MKIGFIGAGNMGGAIVGGIVKNNISNEVKIFDKNPDAVS